MKKIIYFIAMALLCSMTITLQAQEANDKAAEKAAKKAEKEAKKAEKEAKKAAEKAAQEALFQQALLAINNKNFVLEADRVEGKRGQFVYVNSNTNFVAGNGDEATVQLAMNGAFSGPNGVGGITVEGKTSKVEIEQDKKGNVSFSMMVQGVGISAQLTFRMAKGSNECTATILPNFNSNRVSFTGKILPTAQSTVFKGRSL